MKRVLITEDEMIVGLDLERRLKKLGYDVCGVVASGEDAIRAAAQHRPDLVLMDVCLAGEIDGIEAAKQIRHAHDIPVIYLTANADDKTLQRAQATLPANYLLKPFRERELQICIEMSLINHQLQKELKDARDRLEERVQARTAELAAANESLLREMDARAEADKLIRDQAALLDLARDAIFVQRLDGQVVYWNRSAERLYDVPVARALGRSVNELMATLQVFDRSEPMQHTLAAGEWVGEIERRTSAGMALRLESRWTLVRDDRGQPISVLVVETDITERKSLEAQFLRAQRLESVGALASGIAHDLNNVFTPLIMSAQAFEDAPPGSLNAQLADIILTSSQRGADMVKQILLLVRGCEGERLPLPPAHLVKEVQKLICETFPRSIRIQTRSGPDLWNVDADATQLHQLLMNLCVNARDAMPAGGELTIELSNVPADDPALRSHPGAAGRYVRIIVADTGTGMTPETKARIFTPFFTTKEVGQGTGLGLSTVQVIVREHRGFIEVDSAVGRGTRFSIYLPASDEQATEQDLVDLECPQGNGELILLADDEASVREITKTALEAYNYRVVTAEDGTDALSQFAQRPADFSAVIADTSMPYLDGLGCTRALHRIRPHLPVLLVSGNGTQALPAALADEPNLTFLAKPFTRTQLLAALHRCLHAERFARQAS